MAGSVKVTGDKELAKQLAELAKRASGAQIDEALDAAADVLADEMRRTGAFRDATGTLRKSIKVTKDNQGKDKRRKIGPTAPHAHLLEFGTGARRTVPDEKKALRFGDRFAAYTVSSMAARPFIRPAFEKARGEIADEFRDQLKEMLEI